MKLDTLEMFADTNGFDLTKPLTSTQVISLAEHWAPNLNFYWDERYHPIRLNEAIGMVESQFGMMTPLTQESFKVTKLLKEGPLAVPHVFNPPLVTIPDGIAPLAVGSSNLRRTVRVLTESMPPLQALSDSDVNTAARVTHGGSESETRSRRFFGGTNTPLGASVPAEGDPLLPHATHEVEDENGDIEERPIITMMASYKNLLETLEYNILTEENSNYPSDALRMGFDVAGEVLYPIWSGDSPPIPIPRAQLRTLLLAMIAAHKNGDPLPALPPGIGLEKKAWDTLTRYAFIEYSYYYAYNDFERYQTAIWDNEHEGDDEGCCLVFDRNLINLAVASDDPEAALLMIPPHSIITSVHEEYQRADCAKVFTTPVTPATDSAELRNTLDLDLYIAGGSHATYLKGCSTDLVDFGDYLGWVNENAPWLWLGAPLVVTVAIVLHILEHFIDTKDFTSDDGIRTGSGTDSESEGILVDHRIVTVPMSNDLNIYQDRDQRDLLTLVSYPGLWGDHDGVVDKSPPFKPKTGRFFRKLLDII